MAFNDNWSIGAEYRFADYGSWKSPASEANGLEFHQDLDLDAVHAVRVFLNLSLVSSADGAGWSPSRRVVRVRNRPGTRDDGPAASASRAGFDDRVSAGVEHVAVAGPIGHLAENPPRPALLTYGTACRTRGYDAGPVGVLPVALARLIGDDPEHPNEARRIRPLAARHRDRRAARPCGRP